jgi:hypothetical protein
LVAALRDGMPESARVAVRHVGVGGASNRVEVRGAAERGPWLDSASRPRAFARRARLGRARLPGALVAEYGDVESALVRLDAGGGGSCGARRRGRRRVTLGARMTASAAMTAQAFLGRAPGRLGAGRWIGAALLGYAEILARIKVHERRGRT